MIRNVLHHLGGIETFGIVSVCLFFAFFTGMLVWTLSLKRPLLRAMSLVPLEPTNAVPSATSGPTFPDHE